MQLSPLLLIDDPLPNYGLSKQLLINCYYDLVNSNNIHLLGFKSDDNVFHTDKLSYTVPKKYINLFSEIREEVSENNDIYNQVKQNKFTHDLLITSTNHKTINSMQQFLADIFSVKKTDITFNFVEANVTLLAHKDTDYFDKTENIPYPMLTMKSNMITDNAFNWILLGQESHFRLVAEGKRYTNNGSDKVCFFDPCKYKHGTSLNTHRLILTVRFRTLQYKDIIPVIYKNFQVEEVTPII
jgi:hypothetical protein